MTECVVLVRMTDKCVVGLTDGDDENALAVFPNFDAALELAEAHFLCQAKPWQIVELDEL